MKLNSLAFRLFATSAVWTLIVLPIAGLIIYQLYRDDVQASFDERLEKLVTSIAVDSMGGSTPAPVAPNNRYEPLFEEKSSGWYWQIKPLDVTAAGSRLASVSLGTFELPSPLESKVEPDENGARWMKGAGPEGEPIRMVELIDRRIPTEGSPRYSVIVAGPIDWLEARVANFLTRLAVALTLAGVGLVTVTLFQVRFGLLPLQRIEQALAAIRSGAASKLEGDLPAEIEPLKVELNALIQANQDTVERARTHVGNLAHALKTPLTVITNEARGDRTPLGQKVIEQARVMRDQVQHYLDRARVAARVNVIGTATPVAATLAPLVRTLERIYAERSIRITVTCPEGLRFQGERQDFEEMLGNLCDNACKWARGQVFVTASAATAPARGPGVPRRFTIAVEDDGPGLSPDQRARIGKRGLRLDETKPGSGLGLSIVAELAETYHGSLALAASQHGGLRAELELPAV